jgi:hypothetical protein
MTGLALLVTAGVLQAQVTRETEASRAPDQVTTQQMTGEVSWIEGNTLVAKMLPQGDYSVFLVKPGREFVIDGQTKHIGDLKPGTVLTATVTTTVRSVTNRTTSNLKGRVWWVQGNYVVLTLANGENREYKVADSFKFMVDGKPASVSQLKQGMEVSATQIVEEPHTEISENTVITGRSPK